MKNWIREFLICTVLPSIIPIACLIPQEHVSEDARNVLMSACYIFVLIFALRHYCKTGRQIKINHSKEIKGKAYTNAVQLSERKRNYLISKSYNGACHIPKSYIPYDVHDYIAEICTNFRDTVSQITSVSAEHMSITFIYHYTYPGAQAEDQNWRWVIGKEATTQIQLNNFVERTDSLYNYMLKDRTHSKVNTVFSNDKKELARDGHYYMSPRDMDHDEIGSVFAVKVIFANNAKSFVEGVLLVSSYGKKFVENDSEYSINELKNILLDELYPYYQRLLETELGMLYLRHEKRVTVRKSNMRGMK